MLIHPAAIVALVLYLIIGQLTIPQRFQTRFKSLGHGAHQTFSSALSLPHASFEPQDYSVASETTTVETFLTAPVETTVIYPAQIIPTSSVLPEDCVEAIIQEVYPTRHDDHPSPAPTRMFVMSCQCQGPFDWRDLFNYRVLEALTTIYLSIWFPLVVLPFVAKLLSCSESRDEAEVPVDTPPELLPPKFLAPHTTAQIRVLNLRSHAPLEPIFSPAPPQPSTFWLAPGQKQQVQPSSPSPLLRLPDLSFLENNSQLSPLSSPADSGYGTTLSGMASDASSSVPGESVTTTPEHLNTSLFSADTESIPVHGSNSVIITSDNFTGEETDTTEFDIEPEDDDDDGSTTVTNSTANLADLITRPVPVLAEVLAAKLECATAALIEEAKSPPKSPADELLVTVPPSGDLAATLSSHDKPSSGAADTIVDPVRADEMAATGTGLKEDETPVEIDFPSPDNPEKDVESWTPDYEVPTITISPPSDVDPEDSAQQLDSEDEQESELIVGIDSEDDLEYADDYPNDPAAEVVQELPLRPVEVSEDPYRSPITKSGILWSDDEGDDLGPPLRFGEISHLEVAEYLESSTLETSDATEIDEHPEAIDTAKWAEAQVSPAEEETSDTVTSTSEGLNVEEPVAEAAQQLIEEPQQVLKAPTREVAEPVPAELSPSTSLSPSLQGLPCTSKSLRICTQASSDDADRSDGTSRNGRALESPRLKYFHCCKLYRSDGRPKSWENWKIEKPADCIPKKTNLQEWQFVRPTDKDGENPTTRIAIDNLDADWFRTVNGVLSYNYLTEAMGFFPTKSYWCCRGRTIDGVEYSSIGYAIVEFDSVGEAIRMFDELQGRRLRGHTWHWRLEFVDPSDETYGGRKVIRTELVSDSVKQALAAELEASTRRDRRLGQSDNSNNGTPGARPPARVRLQLSIGDRSLFAGAMSNVVQDRRTGRQAAQSTTRVPSQRSHGS